MYCICSYNYLGVCTAFVVVRRSSRWQLLNAKSLFAYVLVSSVC